VWSKFKSNNFVQCFTLIIITIFICSIGLVFLLILLGLLVIFVEINLVKLLNLIDENPLTTYFIGFFLISLFYVKIIKEILYPALSYFNDFSLRFYLILVNLSSYFIVGYILFYDLGFELELSDSLADRINKGINYEIFKNILEEINENNNSLKTLELTFVTAIFPFTTVANYYTSKVINGRELSLINVKLSKLEKRIDKLEGKTPVASKSYPNNFWGFLKVVLRYLIKR